MDTLYKKLYDYSNSDYYAFHMPGHKRQGGMPYAIDITEIDGFDDLHHAEGILKLSQERSARLYHADESHFLVNGSTVGILSAIFGATQKGDTILVARNCHKSVYHAIEMNELDPVYLYPYFDEKLQLNTEISVQDVRDALEKNPGIRAVMIVSPTYDGVVSDVEQIAQAVHEKGLPLIVDEAHGAHFGFCEKFPKNACQNGADIVIHSVHKTLPSLTQTALLHMNGMLVDRARVRKYLHMLQTSSPSYVLMASIDSCMDLLERQGDELFASYVELLGKTREQLKELQNLKVIRTEHYDDSKLVISTKDVELTGKELQEILLREFHLQMEMAAGTYVLAMTTVFDTKEGLERLTKALFSIDNRLKRKDCFHGGKYVGRQPELEIVRKLSEAGDGCGEKREISWEESVGSVSAEYAYLYPPGSPLIVPGERISANVVALMNWYEQHDFSIEGLSRERYIEVFVNE